MGFAMGEKDVIISHINKVSEKKMGFSGKFRISGTNNFRDWFHFDATRPTKNKAIVLEMDYKIYKRLWITLEKYATALNILKNWFDFQI